MGATQLLCSFTTVEAVEATLQQVVGNYDIAFDTIYVLSNVETPSALCLTYNINLGSVVGAHIPPYTISLHRKKATNTLYTINALNLLVMQLNGGKLDKQFLVPWQDYKNSILVTAYNTLKIIPTKLDRIIRVHEIK